MFAALEYELGILIQAEDWFHVGVIALGTIFLAVMLFSQAAAFVGWLVLSPWVALFWHEAVEGALALTFDRVVMLLLLIIVIARRLANREPMKRLQAAEVLLLASFLYTKVVPRMGQNLSMIWALNVLLDSLVTPFIIYFLAKECITTRKHVAGIIIVLFIGGILWSFSGFYEHYYGKMWLSPIVGFDVQLAERDVAQGRAAGPAGHYYVYGGIMILTIFLGLHLAGSAKQAIARFLCLVAASLTVVALYFGYSRAPYLAFGLSLLVAPFMAKRGRWLYTTAAVAVFILAIIAMSSLSTSTQTTRFTSLGSLNSIYGRAAIYRTMINMIRNNFWLGVGYNKSGELAPQYVSSLAHPHSIVGGVRHYKFAHDEYLMIFAEQGIVGFLIYFGAIGAFVVQMLRVRSRLPDNGLLGKGIVIPAFVLVLSYLVMGVTDQFQLNPYLYYVMFAVIATVIRLGELPPEDESVENLSTQQAALTA